MRNLLLSVFLIAALASAASAADFDAPQQVAAGQGVTLHPRGGGDLYVFGPGVAIKRQVEAGKDVQLAPEELGRAGRYQLVLGDARHTLTVFPGEPAKVSFLARPSRVPVAKPDVISGVVFVFDSQQNLVLKPAPVKFELALEGAAGLSRTLQSKDGVAWIKAASGSREGAAQFVASVNGASVRRVVQQVASDPCNIRMKAQRQGENVLVETDPIRDCSGNPVPDGTIVTFIQTGGGEGRSTVDARIKHGVARATLPAIEGATLSVASGVVLGNEIRMGAQR